MQFLTRISQTRERQILSNAKPYLGADDRVLQWLRVKDPRGHGDGFVYLTETSCVVYWRGRTSDPGAIKWDEIRSWALAENESKGPILGIEAADDVVFVQMPVSTRRLADEVDSFVTRFRALAPKPRIRFSKTENLGDFRSDGNVQINHIRRSIGGHTKRVVVTVLGVGATVVGVAMLVLPGPGILVTLAGLAILASEYDWAQDALDWARHKFTDTRARIQARRSGR